MSHPIGFNMKATTVARRERRPGGGPEQSEGIAVSPKELKRGAFYATRFSREFYRSIFISSMKAVVTVAATILLLHGGDLAG